MKKLNYLLAVILFFIFGTAKAQSVSNLNLIQASNAQSLGPLVNGETIYLNQLPTTNLSIQAVTNPTQVGSVEFIIDGSSPHFENVLPYSLCGDSVTSYNACPQLSAVGPHTLTIIIFSGSNGSGTASVPFNYSFAVAGAAPTGISSFSLINAPKATPIPGYSTISNGSVINLSNLNAQELSIQANPTSTYGIGSVKFTLDGTYTHIENLAPYSLCGDSVTSFTPCPQLAAPGAHTLTATVYSGQSATGTASPTYQIAFTLVSTPPVITVTNPNVFKYSISNTTPTTLVTPPGTGQSGSLVSVGNFAYSPQAIFNWSVLFSGSGKGTVTCNLDSSTAPCPGATMSGTGTYSWTVMPGKHTFSLTATDGAGNTTHSTPFTWTYVSPAQQQAAAEATANSSANCTAIQPFYYEIGNSTSGGFNTNTLANGSSTASGQTAVLRNTTNEIASASKWIFGAYAVQELGSSGSIDDTSQQFIHMSSGYDTFVDNSCGISYGVNTVADCENIYCVYDSAGNQVANSPCSLSSASLKAQYPNDFVLPNSSFASSDVGHFSYSGGHFQRFALAHSTPENDGYPSGYGFSLGSYVFNGSSLVGPNNPLLNSEVLGVFGNNMSPFAYGFPQLAGGVITNAGGYAEFLQSILNGSLTIAHFLGKDAVCTNPQDTNCTCPNPADNAKYGNCTALYTPIQRENMHYSYGHWVEDDYNIPYADGSYNSAGAFGFYPWIDPSQTYYGIVARYVQGVVFSGRSTIGNGYASELCGREIRFSFFTGLTAP